MQKTRIEILGLQNKATELRTVNKLSYRQIAEILSKQTGEDISYSVVQRYFSIKEHEKIEVAAKSDKLASRMVTTELDTVDECMKNLTDCQKIFDAAFESGDLRAAILAVAERWKGIDMINKILGKYKNLPELVNNVTQNNVFVSIDQKVKEYEKYFTEIESNIDSNSTG